MVEITYYPTTLSIYINMHEDTLYPYLSDLGIMLLYLKWINNTQKNILYKVEKGYKEGKNKTLISIEKLRDMKELVMDKNL